MRKKIITGLFFAGILFSSTATCYAAPERMPDGTMFDAAYYAQAYPDVAAEVGTGTDALYNHYVTYGKVEGRLPVASSTVSTSDSLVFDAIYYAQAYPDVAAAVGTDAGALYRHYIEHGKAEGRYPSQPAVNEAAARASAPRRATVLNTSVKGGNPYAGKTMVIPGSTLSVDALTYPDNFSMALGNGTVLQYNSLAGISGGYVTAAVSGHNLIINYDFLVSSDGNQFNRLPANAEYLFFIRDATTGATVGIFKNTDGKFLFPSAGGARTFNLNDANQIWMTNNNESLLPNGRYSVTVSTASTSSLVASNIFTIAR